MADLSIDGLDQLTMDLEELANLPTALLEEMINAESDVVVSAQRTKAKVMLSGKYSKGIVSNAISKKKARKAGDGIRQMITVDGIVRDEYHRSGTRVAEIAFINEFGKTGQPARPFMKIANEESADAAVSAALKVYDDYLKSKNL